MLKYVGEAVVVPGFSYHPGNAGVLIQDVKNRHPNVQSVVLEHFITDRGIPKDDVAVCFSGQTLVDLCDYIGLHEQTFPELPLDPGCVVLDAIKGDFIRQTGVLDARQTEGSTQGEIKPGTDVAGQDQSCIAVQTFVVVYLLVDRGRGPGEEGTRVEV